MTKGEQTRQRIVAEAAGLFNKKGYEGSSMLDVMAATGLEKGGLYRHFSSKEQLAAEAFDYAWDLARTTRLHDVDQIENEADRLKQFIANFVERRPPVSGGCPLLNAAVDADDGNPVLLQRVREALRAWQGTLATIVRKGRKSGTIRADADPKKVASWIIGCLEGALMISRVELSRDALLNAKEHLDQYVETQVRSQLY